MLNERRNSRSIESMLHAIELSLTTSILPVLKSFKKPVDCEEPVTIDIHHILSRPTPRLLSFALCLEWSG